MRVRGFFTRVKTHNLFSINENLIEQCFATHIVQMLSTVFSNVVQPDRGWFRLNNAEQYCWQHWTMWATTLLIAVLSIQPWTGYSFFAVYICNFSRVDECSSDRRGADFREDRGVCIGALPKGWPVCSSSVIYLHSISSSLILWIIHNCSHSLNYW